VVRTVPRKAKPAETALVSDARHTRSEWRPAGDSRCRWSPQASPCHLAVGRHRPWQCPGAGSGDTDKRPRPRQHVHCGQPLPAGRLHRPVRARGACEPPSQTHREACAAPGRRADHDLEHDRRLVRHPLIGPDEAAGARAGGVPLLHDAGQRMGPVCRAAYAFLVGHRPRRRVGVVLRGRADGSGDPMAGVACADDRVRGVRVPLLSGHSVGGRADPPAVGDERAVHLPAVRDAAGAGRQRRGAGRGARLPAARRLLGRRPRAGCTALAQWPAALPTEPAAVPLPLRVGALPDGAAVAVLRLGGSGHVPHDGWHRLLRAQRGDVLDLVLLSVAAGAGGRRQLPGHPPGDRGVRLGAELPAVSAAGWLHRPAVLVCLDRARAHSAGDAEDPRGRRPR